MSRNPRDRGGRARVSAALFTVALVLGSCAAGGTVPDAPDTADTPAEAEAESGDEDEAGEAAEDQRHPDVLDAELEPTGGTWRLSATLSSPYDTPERYADAFRALDEDGTELGVRELAHDHANEQPFTRSLSDLEIPEGVERITVQGRDQRYGWGGATVELEVPSDTAGDDLAVVPGEVAAMRASSARSAPSAAMPTTGPGTRTRNAQDQPTAVTSTGTIQIVATVSTNPSASCNVTAVPT